VSHKYVISSIAFVSGSESYAKNGIKKKKTARDRYLCKENQNGQGKFA